MRNANIEGKHLHKVWNIGCSYEINEKELLLQKVVTKTFFVNKRFECLY